MAKSMEQVIAGNINKYKSAVGEAINASTTTGPKPGKPTLAQAQAQAKVGPGKPKKMTAQERKRTPRNIKTQVTKAASKEHARRETEQEKYKRLKAKYGTKAEFGNYGDLNYKKTGP